MIVVSDGVARHLTEQEWREFQSELAENVAASFEFHGYELGQVHNVKTYPDVSEVDCDPFGSLLMIEDNQLIELRSDQWLEYLTDQISGRVLSVRDYGQDWGPVLQLADDDQAAKSLAKAA